MHNEDMYGNLSYRNPMATASAIFGIASLFTCIMINLALPLGALAVLFAILSRTERKMRTKSKVGLICGLCGIIATTVISVGSVYYVMTTPTARSYLEQYFQYYTGDSDFSLEELFPFLYAGDTDTASDVPDSLVSPDDPDASDTLTIPDNPDASNILTSPDDPDASDILTSPDNPDASDIPTSPDDPDASGHPGAPDVPASPDSPSSPFSPDSPSDSSSQEGGKFI